MWVSWLWAWFLIAKHKKYLKLGECFLVLMAISTLTLLPLNDSSLQLMMECGLLRWWERIGKDVEFALQFYPQSWIWNTQDYKVSCACRLHWNRLMPPHYLSRWCFCTLKSVKYAMVLWARLDPDFFLLLWACQGETTDSHFLKPQPYNFPTEKSVWFSLCLVIGRTKWDLGAV